MQEIADCSLQYPMQILNYYNYTKDKETLIDLYPTICGILDYFKRFEREDGLLENVHEKNNIVQGVVIIYYTLYAYTMVI